MHIVFSSGIYPPELGGPATYIVALARELQALGHTVEVIAYGESDRTKDASHTWPVHFVSRQGFFWRRMWRYSRKINEIAARADIFYGFTSISCGIPMMLSGIQKPRKILRLGGDFLWERYTDMGGSRTLPDFYTKPPFGWRLMQWAMRFILRSFDLIIFSTHWQQKIYQAHMLWLPKNIVIENALDISGITPAEHTLHTPVKLLSYGRAVRFKQIELLVKAMPHLPDATLTIVTDGPRLSAIARLVTALALQDRITIVPPVSKKEVAALFAKHDVLVISSLSDISPNAALEAAAHGLPVLLSHSNGLGALCTSNMCLCNTSSVMHIVLSIVEMLKNYDVYTKTVPSIETRSWSTVTAEHHVVFTDLR